MTPTRASIAAHSIALMIHDSFQTNETPDFAELRQWHERWHHAAMRIRDSGPDDTTGSGIVVTTQLLPD